MAYQIKWDKRAYKELKGLEVKDAVNILNNLNKLYEDPNDPSKELKGMLLHQFPAADQMLKKQLDNCFLLLSERCILEKQTAKEGSVYSTGIVRKVTEDAKPITLDQYYSPHSKKELVQLTKQIAEEKGLNIPYSNKTKYDIVKNLSYLLVAQGAETSGDVQNEMKKIAFPTITFSEVNNAIKYLRRENKIIAIPTNPKAKKLKFKYSLPEKK